MNGPSWSPDKKQNFISNKKEKIVEENSDLNSGLVKEASKDSVRAIMLIRAYRIRGHLIANLDPLSIQEKKNTQSLNLRHMVLQKKIIIEKFS